MGPKSYDFTSLSSIGVDIMLVVVGLAFTFVYQVIDKANLEVVAYML